MEAVFYDRLQGRYVTPGGADELLGWWRVDSRERSELFLNSVPLAREEFLVPDVNNTWSLTSPGGWCKSGSFHRSLIPEDFNVVSILTLGEQLSRLEQLPWSEWQKVSPIVPGASEDVELSELDHVIGTHVSHLESVCHQPRTYLDIEIVCVPVSEARRIPISAANYLAAHTEDWERHKIRTVVPKRILSELRHDQLDIYENRVATRLIDHIQLYINRRILKLRKIIRVFEEKSNYSEKATGTYLRQQRICELWGELIDSNVGIRKAQATMRVLESFKYRFLSLTDTPLYRYLRRRAQVPNTLRLTNILTNDQHYRRVAELWRAWAEYGISNLTSHKDIFHKYQSLCHAFDNYATLLIIRALGQLKYTPKDEKAVVCRGSSITLNGHAKIDVQWERDGTVLISVEGKRVLKIIPIISSLGGITSDERLDVYLEQIIAAFRASGETSILILYPAGEQPEQNKLSEVARLRIHNVGNDPRTHLPPGIGLLPVSPWEIGSVERVGRALRWVIDKARFKTYPPKLRKPSGNLLKFDRCKEWIEVRGTELNLLRPPSPEQARALGVEEAIMLAESQASAAKKSVEEISKKLLVKRGEKGVVGQLVREKKEAERSSKQWEDLHAELYQFRGIYSLAIKELDGLLICPACGTDADPLLDFSPRSDGNFRCACNGCNARWEMRKCGRAHRYPVMMPGKFEHMCDFSAESADRVWGSDILALPAGAGDNFQEFMCPECTAALDDVSATYI